VAENPVIFQNSNVNIVQTFYFFRAITHTHSFFNDKNGVQKKKRDREIQLQNAYLFVFGFENS